MNFYVDSTSMERYRFRKIMNKKNLYKLLVALLVMLLAGGYLYENWQSKVYGDLYEGYTTTVNMTTYQYTIHGSKGPIIVVDGAIGESPLQRQRLVDAFEGEARLFFYNRPGYGRTKEGLKTPREVAEDLHFMFIRFGWPMEFIFLGEEYGSLVMQEYINLYPEEVLGAVFINPMGKALGSEEMRRFEQVRTASYPSKEGLGLFGIPRFLQNYGIMDFFQSVQHLEEEKEVYANLHLSKSFIQAMKNEYAFMSAADPIPIRLGALGDKPLYVITSALNASRFEQEDFARYSSDSHVFYVQDVVQDVLLERSEDVGRILKDVVDQAVRLANRRR